jgi:hypothetical protein
MQEKNHPKTLIRPGRPKKSSLTPREQARRRKRKQRTKFAQMSLTKVELLLPKEVKERIKKAAAGKSYSVVGEEAFRLWLERKKD